MNISPSELRAIMRQDFVLFIQRCFLYLNPGAPFHNNFHIEVMASELQACLRGETKRLIINIPPRYLKSIVVSVALVAWWLGHKPSAHIMAVSYGQDLADKLARDCRSVMLSPWYQKLFQTRLQPKKLAVSDFETTQFGSRMARSVGGPTTGRGAELILLDDPCKPEEALSDTVRESVNDWFSHTLLSRLNDKREGCIVLVMQRLHENDLSGYLREKGGWKVLELPAIAQEDETHVVQTPYGEEVRTRSKGVALHPEREPLEVLEQIRSSLGDYFFAAQYLQMPAPPGGGMVKQGWFKWYTPGEQPGTFDRVVCSWDTANKPTELADYSVCTVWGMRDKKVYLLFVYRDKLDYPSLRKKVRELRDQFNAGVVLIEDKASGTQLIQDLHWEGVYGVSRYEPTMDKQMRLHAVTGTMEAGLVYLPSEAVWLKEYLKELLTFPKAKNDDQVDSTAQFLDWVRNCQGPNYAVLNRW